MTKLSIRALNLQGKKVFLRVDFNVPLESGKVADDTRIRATLPTLELARRQGARLVLASHLGRPKGKRKPEMSLRPAAERLGQLLKARVEFAEDCIGAEAEKKSQALKDGDVLLLENLRFHPEEEKNDAGFSRALARHGRLYVNDAFGSAHRAHASTVGVTKVLEKAAAGLLMEKELNYLGKAIQNPEHPYVAVLGGAKVADKIELIQNLLKLVDTLILGGGMAYSFLRAQGIRVGKSLVEEDKLELARQLLEEAASRQVNVRLPEDHLVAEKIDPGAAPRTVGVNEIPDELMGLDIGPQSRKSFCQALQGAKTIVWNGPMGVFECEPFAEGTMVLARAIADSGATSIVGGGDSIAALYKAGVAEQISHISTGGGASLEFLGGRKLPGVEALTDK
ncbi:phosphoglycerate kinase [Acidobacteriia bacterium AH_259_A11_L15]|nr:phosphoglycerate kinase [Acidobacteriia bacterium AH_259_A11_L15]